MTFLYVNFLFWRGPKMHVLRNTAQNTDSLSSDVDFE